MAATVAVRAKARTALHATARAYARNGWAVFPVQPSGKVPATSNGCKAATVDLEQVDRWWTRNPDYNIGVATGSVSGLVVVDLDGPQGFESWSFLANLHRAPDTLWCFTGSGGWHAYFTHPGGLRNSASKIAPGIDIRAEGGYVVAPPSIHPCGEPYTWHTRRRPVPLPEPLELMSRPKPTVRHDFTPPAGGSNGYTRAALRGETEAVAAAPSGTRNDQLVKSAFKLGTLVGAGDLDATEATEALLAAAAACGLPDREAEATVRSGLAAGADNPRNRS